MPALTSFCAGQAEVLLAYLFGSVARGQAGVLSDIDIAVLVQDGLDRHAIFELRLRLIGDLMALLHSDDVDLVVMNQAALALSYRVFRDGIQLFTRDRRRSVLYQADIVSRYLDFKPFLERYQRTILARARRGELLRGHNPYRGSIDHYRQLREGTDH